MEIMRVGGFLVVLAGHLAFTAFSEKCGGTPKFCGKLPSFSPMHFSRSDHEHSFLGFHLLSRLSPVLFGETKKERETTRRKETPSHRKPHLQWTGSPLFVAPVVRRVWAGGARSLSLLKLCFPFLHLLPIDAVSVQLLRLVAELACSCPALPLLYVLVVWNQAVCQLEGLE